MAIVSIGHPVPVTYGTQPGQAVFALGLCSYPVVGWLIARRDPRNRIAWLFFLIGLMGGFHLSSATYGQLATDVFDLPFAVQAAWVGNWGWVGWIGVIGTLVAPLFPAGRPVTRRLWPVIFLVAVGLVAGAVAEAIAPGPLEVDPRYNNPFGVDTPVVGALEAGLFAIPLGVLIGVISLIIRYRRGDEIVRLQLRWLILAISAVGTGFVIVLLPGSAWSDATLVDTLPTRIFQDVVTAGWSFIAIAVGIAVLRYRLYAVDVVINRALVYAAITVLLGGTYFLAVFLLQTVLAPLAGGTDIAVAVSTLLVAALFRPVRRRVQSVVDRRFYRTRYNAQLLLEGFASRLRRQIDLDGVVTEMRSAVREAVAPARADVWIFPRRPAGTPPAEGKPW